MQKNLTQDTNDGERTLWAAELALARETLATSFSFALLSLSDSLQHLASIAETSSGSIVKDGIPPFLAACNGVVPKVQIDRTSLALSAGLLTTAEAEAVACLLVLEERLRPQAWREHRVPERKEVERAVAIARTLLNKIRLHES